LQVTVFELNRCVVDHQRQDHHRALSAHAPWIALAVTALNRLTALALRPAPSG
jgi:hypothetical protein